MKNFKYPSENVEIMFTSNLSETEQIQKVKNVLDFYKINVSSASRLFCEDSFQDESYPLQVKFEYGEGGHEGAGEYVEKVFSLHENDEIISFFAFYGSYDSFDGTTWEEEINIVVPEKYTSVRFISYT